MTNKTLKLLILGGTTEARRLVSELQSTFGDKIETIYSLAGITGNPPKLSGRQRTGGFGGENGFRDYLLKERIDAVLCATHPFATQMPRTAYHVTKALEIPFIQMMRPPWVETDSDRWHRAAGLEQATEMLKQLGDKVLLTVGSNDLRYFTEIEKSCLYARMIEPPSMDGLPENMQIILDRPPFSLESEKTLLNSLEIDLLVTKNSGGSMVAAKIQAARDLAIPILMIDRPGTVVKNIVCLPDEAINWTRNLLDTEEC